MTEQELATIERWNQETGHVCGQCHDLVPALVAEVRALQKFIGNNQPDDWHGGEAYYHAARALGVRSGYCVDGQYDD